MKGDKHRKDGAAVAPEHHIGQVVGVAQDESGHDQCDPLGARGDPDKGAEEGRQQV